MTIYYTGRGDKGKSEMGARKISKSDPLFDALGALDELNSWIGLCRSELRKDKRFVDIERSLLRIQETLFIAQAELAMIGMRRSSKIMIQKEKTVDLEQEIAEIDKKVPQIKQFIIPGASEVSARLDVARSLARNVERAFVKFAQKQKLNPNLLQYLNRLSSILFAHARMVNYVLKVREENPSYR